MNEEAKKSRSPRAPVLNPHHLAKAYAEAEGDFYKVLAWLSSHYNHPYKPQQVKNAYVRLNRELVERGYEPLKFAPARKNSAYLDTFAVEWAGRGLLKKKAEQMTIPTVVPAKKPATKTTK
jgi:hypothetical protein